LFLFDSGAGDIDVAVSIPVIVGTVVATAGFVFFVLGAALQARRMPPATGAEEILGSTGSVIDWHETNGNVRVLGEMWAARSAQPLKPNDPVRVVARDGLTLVVEPLENVHPGQAFAGTSAERRS
jgi:membrane-bound serine protease (ClpP class)